MKQDDSAAGIVDKLPPKPAGMRCNPLPVALSHRSAPALHDSSTGSPAQRL